jgi:hypothetical protein
VVVGAPTHLLCRLVVEGVPRREAEQGVPCALVADGHGDEVVAPVVLVQHHPAGAVRVQVCVFKAVSAD